ncbi:hypothetical protein ACFL5S_01310 [Fibrobacterota bacterium]
MKSKKDIMSRYHAVFNVIKPAIEAVIGLIVGKGVLLFTFEKCQRISKDG